MKKCLPVLAVMMTCVVCTWQSASAQCSICTKTASQLGEKPAKGMNSGILYLAFTPLAIAGFLGYRWWKREQAVLQDEQSA